MIRYRATALATALLLAGLSPAAAQFPPPPGPAAPAQGSAFPPPPGQARPAQGSAFPPPQGQAGNPFPPAGQSSPFPPAGGVASQPASQGNPFGPPGGGPPANSPCAAFPPLREAAEKGAGAIRAAGDRKAGREEVCPLFKRFAAAEANMISFLEKHRNDCGVPAEAIKQAKANHAKTVNVRNNVCSAGPTQAAPTLSDALGGPILPDETNTKRGAGTFDTLTGSPLGRR